MENPNVLPITAKELDEKIHATIAAKMYDPRWITTSGPYMDRSSFYNAVMSATAKLGSNTKKQTEPEEPEEWIWVTGYKGTDKDMKCRDYQYEIGKMASMPDDAKIVECNSGFHLCKELKHVFQHYKIGDGNRFFEVQALVRKKDADAYGKARITYSSAYGLNVAGQKLVAKKIVFTRELTVDEILKDTEAANWSDEYKKMVMNKGIDAVRNMLHVDHLVELGFSKAFAEWVVYEECEYDTAVKVASQKDLSMDMKVLCIIRGL